MSYSHSFIMEESRTRDGGVVTLEKLHGDSAELARFRVKSVKIKHFSAEADARAYYEKETSQKRRKANADGIKK